MPHANNYDAITGINETIELSAKDIETMLQGDTNVLIADKIAANAEAKAALLKRLGITADEAALLLG
jgi:hypothetical protein